MEPAVRHHLWRNLAHRHSRRLALLEIQQLFRQRRLQGGLAFALALAKGCNGSSKAGFQNFNSTLTHDLANPLLNTDLDWIARQARFLRGGIHVAARRHDELRPVSVHGRKAVLMNARTTIAGFRRARSGPLPAPRLSLCWRSCRLRRRPRWRRLLRQGPSRRLPPRSRPQTDRMESLRERTICRAVRRGLF